MTMVTPKYGMPYTVIPMNRLDEARKLTRETFREVGRKEKVRYSFRTFYIGQRAKKTDMHVLKGRAIGAKLAVYRHYYKSWNGQPFEMKELVAYV